MTTRERSALWPELPTVSETKGIDYEYGLWYAVLAPARTPLAVRNRLQKELAAVVDEPEMRAWMTQNGFEHIARGSPDDLAALLDREVETWGTLIRRLKITAE